MAVMVCVPTSGDIYCKTTAAVFSICATHPGGASFRTIQAQPADHCRNLCVATFLKSPHSHLLFIDSDVVPPDDALKLMLSANRLVVCGIYPLQLEDAVVASVSRKIAPHTYRFLRDCPDEPFEIDAAGMGCCLISREVFDLIEHPWFEFEVRADGNQTGEDIYFFERCAEVGIRPLAMPQVLCAHHRVVDLLVQFNEVRRLRREMAASAP